MIVLHVILENLPDVRRAFERARDMVSTGCVKAVTQGTAEGVAEMLAVRTWKDVSGKTRQATRGYLTTQSREGAEGIMECAVDNASYLDSGTVAHTIRPKAVRGSKKASRSPGQSVRARNDIGTTRVSLRWYDGGGQPVFRKEVHHPGTKGDGFFGKGVQKCERVMIREIESGVARAQVVLDA